MPVPLLIDTRDALQGFSSLHDPLDDFRVAVLQKHGLGQHLDSLFVGVKIVCQNRVQPVSEHPVAIERIHFDVHRMGNLFWINPHQSCPWPETGQVSIIGKAATEFPIFDLSLINPPVNKVLQQLQDFDLPESP